MAKKIILIIYLIILVLAMSIISQAQAANNAPVLDLIGGKQLNEGGLLDFTLTASDTDNDSLAFSTDSAKGTINSQSGYFSWQTAFDESGIYFVKFTVSDGTDEDSEIIMVNVTEAGNHAPVLNLIGGKQLIEGGNLEFTVSASDIDNDQLIFSTNSSSGTVNSATGYFQWQTDFDDAGIYFVYFDASDGSEKSAEIIMVNVTEAGNHAPQLNLIGGKQADENSLLEFTLSASDLDNDVLAYSTNFTKGSLDSATGVFSWRPSLTESGVYFIEFSASDATEKSSEIIMLNVTEAGNNVGGELKDLEIYANENESISSNLSGISRISIKKDGSKLLEFDWDFSSNYYLALSSISIQSGFLNGAEKIIVNGLNLPDGAKKTAYLNRTNESMNAVCIYDRENVAFNDMQKCGGDEIKIRCNGEPSNGYRCTKSGSTYRIDGLGHSGVSQHYIAEPEEEQQASQSSASSQSSGSSTEGSTIPLFWPRKSDSQANEQIFAETEEEKQSPAENTVTGQEGNYLDSIARNPSDPSNEITANAVANQKAVAMPLFTLLLMLVIVSAGIYVIYGGFDSKKLFSIKKN